MIVVLNKLFVYFICLNIKYPKITTKVMYQQSPAEIQKLKSL